MFFAMLFCNVLLLRNKALNASKLSPLGADQLGEMGCVAPGVDAAAALQCDVGAKEFTTQLTPQSGAWDTGDAVDHR
jgi:hypothetical protein